MNDIDWLAFLTNFINKVPIERVLFPPRDNAKALEEFVRTQTPPESQNKAPSAPKITTSMKTPERGVQRTSTAVLERPGLTTEQTIAYQNREIGKQLLAMESHYAQKMRIAGVPCDCGATKHLLYLEELCQETVPMAGEPSIYEEIISWVRDAEPKSTEEVAKSGRLDDEYPVLSGQARDFRKRLLGNLSPAAMIETREPVSLEEAKSIAAEEAAKEVEKRWQSPEKKSAT